MVDLAWAAGIFEGGGCINTKAKAATQVTVTQRDTYILYKLQELFGGYVYIPKPPHCALWQTTGARARGFIFTVFSWLSPRRRKQIRKELAKWRPTE